MTHKDPFTSYIRQMIGINKDFKFFSDSGTFTNLALNNLAVSGNGPDEFLLYFPKVSG